ncbi:hypothetical protein E2C01_018582 [Portunus trituberculatus]|uniref:Uncharacterized protein n=1 Tax=Portunus trituberculatus TaxID=210409 RepID=A0A5B7DWU4_PORTR|nr:hypothetical protein [Portunus trituberculatus]
MRGQWYLFAHFSNHGWARQDGAKQADLKGEGSDGLPYSQEFQSSLKVSSPYCADNKASAWK